MLEHIYPERTITVTSRDPDYITAKTKALLRRKNRRVAFRQSRRSQHGSKENRRKQMLSTSK